MNVIIFPHTEGDGGIAVMFPAPAARMDIVTKEAVYRDTFTTVEADTGELDENGEPIFETVKMPGEPLLVSPEESRPETDDEFFHRIARKDVPSGVPYRIVSYEAAQAFQANGNASFEEVSPSLGGAIR